MAWLNSFQDQGCTFVSTQEYQIPSPSESAPSRGRSRDRKRKRVCSMDSQARKRTQQQMNATVHLPPQSLVDLSSRSILSPRSPSQASSPSRSTSPTRDLLNTLRVSRPSVDCQSPDSPMAPIAVEVRKMLNKDFGDAIIPAALKEHLFAADPQGFEEIPSTAFDHAYSGTQEELDTLWHEVQQIHLEASECHMFNQDENSWAQDVARRVLSWCPSKSGPQFLQLKSVQTQTINRTYLPVSAIQAPISKKADYALVYSRKDSAVRSVYDRFDRAGIALSQMTDIYTKRLVMAFGTEIRPAGGNSQEALAQLAIWFAAGFAKLCELQALALPRQEEEEPFLGEQRDHREGPGATPRNTSTGEDQPASMQREPPFQQQLETEQASPQPLPPMIGFTAVGHEWAMYIACEHFTEDNQKIIQVTGPFPRLMASTRTFYDIFKLLSLVGRVRTFAQDVHWPALKNHVLLPLIERI
ncbi:MAG: hypothetical protein Q9209_005533 [Squamulea sp. 1 TL-2023]